MDVKKASEAIGFFELAGHLAKVRDSKEAVRKAGADMPLPEGDVQKRIQRAASWLLGFDKDKYMFLVPEIALMEEMGKQSSKEIETILTIPCGMEMEEKERIRSNLPRGTEVHILEEPYFPEAFYPGNGMIVISGYLGGGRAMVLSETYRMAEHYGSFLGRTVFLPYTELDTALRYNGWMELNSQRMIQKWRSEV